MATFAGCKITGKAGTIHADRGGHRLHDHHQQRLHHHLRHGHPAGLHHPARRRGRRHRLGHPAGGHRRGRLGQHGHQLGRLDHPRRRHRQPGGDPRLHHQPAHPDQRRGHLRRLQDHRHDRPTYTLTAAASGFTTITSNAFTITIGGASQLAFTSQPGGGANGTAWGTQPAVTVQDVGGNTVTTATNSITLAVGAGSPAGTLACTGGNPLTATNGVATFAGCKITGKAGTTYTLTAAATGLTGATSNAFTITFGTATQLVFSAQPGGGANGATWTTQPAVTVEDQSGNTVTNSANSITLAVGAGSPAGTLACSGGNSLTPTNGVATFAGCEITGKIGTTYTLTAAATGFTTITSNTFTITFGPGSQLVFSTQPGGGVDGAPGAPSRRSPSRTSRATW